MIDVHSQHQTLELSEEDFQFKILDAIADNQDSLLKFQSVLKQYRHTKSVLESKRNEFSSILKEKDYNDFLYQELETANLKSGELEDLEKTYQALNNVEFIKENLEKLLQISNEDEFGILKNLKEFKAILQKNSNFSEKFLLLLERTNSIVIEFDDVIKELNQESELVL